MKELMVKLFYPMAYAMINKKCEDYEMRQELYQDAKLQILEAIEAFDLEGHRHVFFRYYLQRRIAFMISSRNQRRYLENKRFPHSLDEPLANPKTGEPLDTRLDLLADDNKDTPKQAIQSCVFGELNQAMETLDSTTFRLMEKHFYQDKTYAEIAKEEGLDRSTIGKKCKKGIAQLREVLET